MGEHLIYLIYVNNGNLCPLKYIFEFKEGFKTEYPFKDRPSDIWDLDENNPEHQQYYYDYDKDMKYQKDLKKEIATRFMESTKAITSINEVIFAEPFECVYFTKEK